MELRCLLRFAEEGGQARAILEAVSEDRSITVNVTAAGADKSEAVNALAERTRELFGAVSGVVETVEEVARTYSDTGD